MAVLFTVQVETNAGLADKLGKFLRLYRLGQALGYQYVHTPSFESARSAAPRKPNKLAQLLKPFSREVQEPSLAEFLGLDSHEEMITAERYRSRQTKLVDMSAVFADRNFKGPFELQQLIERPSNQLIYAFHWRGKWIPKSIKRLDRYLEAWCEMDSRQAANEGLELPKKYLSAREKWPQTVPFDASKIRIAIHIRKGDRAVIRLQQKMITIHAAKVKSFSEEQLASLNARRGYSRSAIEVSEVVGCLSRILSEFGPNRFSSIVVSDGYDRTFRTIRQALQRGQLVLDPEELRQLDEVEKTISAEFDAFQSLPNTIAIVGESREKLFQSIHAIVSADIVISTVGGFPMLHQWFHPCESFSMMVNFNAGCDQIIKRIGKGLAKLEQQA